MADADQGPEPGSDEVPIGAVEDYGFIGDTRTGALCSRFGSIDWLCLPIFHSEPVFGRLVGGKSWGSFSIRPEGARATKRRYLGETAILETTFRTARATAVLTEGMVLDVARDLRPQALLVRRLEAREGPVDLLVRFDPRRRGIAPRDRSWGDALVCSWGSLALGIRTTPSLPLIPGRTVRATVPAGGAITFAVSLANRQPLVAYDPAGAWAALVETQRFWADWTQGIDYEGPRRGAVVRNLLTLRLLTFSPSGAPVAAPTTSLPESLEGEANWDYRFSWPRDASIGIETFIGVGRTEEATSFMRWLRHASRLTHPRLAPLYTAYGRSPSAERIIPDASGYQGVGPVRFGNYAARQHQLDVYGWVMEAAWQLTSRGLSLDAATWRDWAAFADLVADRWRDPDAGIWEERDRLRHHVHSKLMAWQALDRALRIAENRGVGTSRRTARRLRRWAHERDGIASEVVERGVDASRGAYLRDYDSTDLDAAILSILPAFEPPDSPRLHATIRAIRTELGAGGPLVYRLRPSSATTSGREGAFVACSFWLVRALVHAGRIDDAQAVFEDCCIAANDVGLFAEEIDPVNGTFLGNFPQALSHATATQAALALAGVSGAAGKLQAERRTRRGR
jgi:GH15 family glucan-1,4-alpha-glucosidase